MTAARLGAVVVIFLTVSVAWAVLSGAMYARTTTSETGLRPKVEGLWGGPLTQHAPEVVAKWTERPAAGGAAQEQSSALVLDSSKIGLDLKADFRRKGLIWYRTYEVVFDGQYEVVNDRDKPSRIEATFLFPSQSATYDEFVFSVGDAQAKGVVATDQGVRVAASAEAGARVPMKIHYRSRGLDTWRYVFGAGTTQVNNCTITAHTDFARVDFPDQTLAPSTKREAGTGWDLTWQFSSLVSGLGIAIEMPSKLDPGPWATRISAFAPIGLFFFLAVLVIVGVLTGKNLHPMHYMFVCAAFFAFHLLLAYLVDHIDMHLAFAISAACSVLLVFTYLVRAAGAKFTVAVASPSQLIFLVLFSYSFFYPGYTGLSITIGAILTLAILMHLTAKVDWEDKLSPKPKGGCPPTPDTPLPTRLVEGRSGDLSQRPVTREHGSAGHP